MFLPFRYNRLPHVPTLQKFQVLRPIKDIRTLVFITDGKYALAKDVKTGIQDNTYIEILSGISTNDR